LLLSLSVALPACEEVVMDMGVDPIPESIQSGQILVEPAVLDFGNVKCGQTDTLELHIHNTGIDDLIIDEIALSDVHVNGSFHIDGDPWQTILAPDESTTIGVTYTPDEDGEALSNLLIRSDDTDTPEIRVPFRGGCEAPRLQISPSVWHFDDLPVGCPQTQRITLHNVGSAPLHIHDIAASFTSDDFSVTGLPETEVILPPRQWTAFTVYYEPQNEYPDSAFFVVNSNDPTEPATEVTITGEAHFSHEVADVYEQEAPYSTDLLLVVDNSCSMTDHQQTLSDNVESFLSVLESYAPDYHIAVVTTDDATFQGPVPYLTPETPYVNALFASSVSVGTMGASTEEGLIHAVEALSGSLAAPGGINHGFLREDGALRVLIITDVDDQSPDDVADYVADLQGLKDDPSMVMISAVAAATEGGCDPAPRYEQAVAMTEGLSESICTDQWTDTMTSPLWLTEGLRTTFDLGSSPVDNTVAVHLNGVLMTEGWVYNPDFNRIEFDEDHIPHAGDEIGLHYHPLGCSN